MFPSCVTGPTTVLLCPGGGSPTPSLDGCCIATPGIVEVQYVCGGTDDSATVYLRVEQPDANECRSYTLAYHF